MKRLFFYTILCYLIPFRVFALADLTLSQGSIDNNRLNRGEYLTVRATAINQGDRVATATYGEIYLRQVGTTRSEEHTSELQSPC